MEEAQDFIVDVFMHASTPSPPLISLSILFFCVAGKDDRKKNVGSFQSINWRSESSMEFGLMALRTT